MAKTVFGGPWPRIRTTTAKMHRPVSELTRTIVLFDGRPRRPMLPARQSHVPHDKLAPRAALIAPNPNHHPVRARARPADAGGHALWPVSSRDCSVPGSGP